METVPARELRNDVSSILRKVVSGESYVVTLRGQPVAQLTPLPARTRWVSSEALFADAERWRADPGLTKDLAELLPETTDDIPIE